MKEWSSTHPKAKLMAQKRSAILTAAKQAFLDQGYGGVSMESIASEAGVSIMTLYRHASNKEDVFKAVIADMCNFTDQVRDERFAQSMHLELSVALTAIGIKFQEKLYSPHTLSLLRAVIAEAKQFPTLAEQAYNSIVVSYQSNIVLYLELRPETNMLPASTRMQLGAELIERLTGKAALEALLGVATIPHEQFQPRAQQAVAQLLKQV